MTTAGTRPTASHETDDYWLEDSEFTPARSNLRDSFAVSAQWTKRGVLFARTTIGTMTLLSVLLTFAIIAAGVSMAQSTERRQASLTALMNTTEPMSAATQDIFTSLSLADTTATTGFVQAGVETPETRDKYQRALQRASQAATTSAAGVQSSQTREIELLGIIQAQLPIYAGLVETARTNNRLGNPVGVAYMSEASSLMRTSILPAAKELLDLSNARVNEQQHQLTTPQWIPISGLVAALIMLILAQRWLAIKTRRRLNKGALAATAFMSIALIWVATSNALTWHAGNRGFEEASAPLNSLANARVLAQQARTAETLALVRRETTADGFEGFGTTSTRINQALDEYSSTQLAGNSNNKQAVETIRAEMQEWTTAHDRLASALNQGDYGTATQIAFHQGSASAANGAGTTASGSAAEAYDAVDSNIAKLMLDTRGTLRQFIRNGLVATKLVSSIVLLLSALSVISLWLGIRPRIQEYL